MKTTQTNPVSWFMVVAMAGSLLVGNLASAALISLQEGTNGYTGTEDTILVQESANNNFGGRSTIIVGSTTGVGGNYRDTLIRYDLTGIAGQFTTVNSMALKLTVNTTQPTALPFRVALQREANGNWVEGTVNGTAQIGSSSWTYKQYNTVNWAGAVGARGAGDLYGTMATATLTTAANPINSVVTLNLNPGSLPSNVNTLTKIVNLWNTAGNNAGLHMEQTTNPGARNDWHFESSESTDVAERPILQLSATGTITWNVAGDGAWNTSANNWKMGSYVASYENADIANFSNTAGGIITVAGGGVTPGGVNVSAASGTYTFTGGGIGGVGNLHKSGDGALVLANQNTYTGDTTITAGALTLADDASLLFVIGSSGINNQINGTGTVNLDGDFNFDLSIAGTTPGDSWTIVDVANLNATFGDTFSVNGFTDNLDNTWSSGLYKFDEGTGILQVIPEPSTWALVALALIPLFLRRRHDG